MSFFTSSVLAQGGGAPQIINLEFNTSRELVYLQGGVAEVHLCQLKPGETYLIQAVAMENCQPLLELAGYGMQPQSMYNFIASAECQTILVHADKANSSCQGVMYMSVICSTCAAKPLPNEGTTRAPILVFPGINPTELVENVFVGGGCFDVEGVSHQGAFVSRGSFASGLTSIGINSGVILSSGDVSLATGPNTISNAGAATGGGSDPDLAQAAGIGVFDASVLTFQFTPTESQVTFRYVFASEEYCEYVNSSFNDVFGFFLSGPGISGPYSNNAANIAVLPGLGGAVTINNVNHLVNTAFYTPNMPNPPTTGVCAGHPPAGPPGTAECQYDGFTTVLTAVANVIPCQTYTIKLGVADAGDSAYDSAVFLEGNSFDAGGIAQVIANVPFTQSTLAYEGCTPGYFLFTRSPPLNQPLTINFTISGTATPGQDYTPFPSSITFPANQSTLQLPVNILTDLLQEGIETITITLFNPCSCTTSSATLQISDLPPLSVTLPDQTVCSGQPVTLTPTISGGVQPYTYTWSPPNSGPVYVGFPTQSGPISVTVTDHCGTTATATSNINVYTLSATISGTASVCQGGAPGFLTVNFTGIGPWNLTYLINGGSPATVNNITQNPYQLQVTQPGTYTVIAVTNGICLGNGFGQGIVTQPQINLLPQVTTISCNGGADGAIDLSVDGGTSPYTYVWNNNANTQDIQNLTMGNYTVTVTDAQGCNTNLTVPVGQPAALAASINILSGVDCTNPTGGSLDLSVSGGTTEYGYLWNTGDTLQNLSGLTAGDYTVTVTDANGCEATASGTIIGDTNIPTANIVVIGVVDCANTAITLDGGGSSSGTDFIYQWEASGGGLITGPLDEWITTASGGGVYELTVTDTLNNCYTLASVVVPADFNTPLANPGADQVINCYFSEVVLDGAGSSAGPNIVYAWSTQTGNFTSSTDIASPTVDAPGIYTLVVTNSGNSCADTATVEVTTDLADPLADAGADGVLDCAAPTFQLDGAGSSAGSDFSYLWTTVDGNITGDPTQPNPTANQAGTYVLLVTNTVNGCVATDSASIEDLIVLPVIQIETPDLLTCAITEINLDASNSAPGPGYTFLWTGMNGGVVLSGENTATPLVGATGTYQLTLTNTITGCQSIDSVEVTDDLTPPVADAGVPLTIACNLPNMLLDGSASSAGPLISYAWVAANGGNIVGGANTVSPTINSPGTYILTVIDGGNGCSAQDSVQVVVDSNTPNAVATAPQILNCTNTSVLINGIGSSLGPNFQYTWTTTNGNIISGNGTLFLTVGAPGTYSLTVTNLLNACTSDTDVTLGIDTLSPIAQIAAPDLLTCAVTEISLSGVGSSAGSTFTYAWTTTNGNISGNPTDLDTEVNQPGIYVLTVTNSANGCKTTASVAVSQDIVAPDAEAGAPGLLTCGVTQLALSGAGSSTGANFTYTWNTANGNILSGVNTLSPVINAPGTYEITVFNAANGCSSTDQAMVNQDVSPPQAVILTPGILTCSQTILSLNGATSSGSSPLLYSWTTANGNIVGASTVATPQVDQPGAYTLVVTNTANQCADTAQISVSQNIVPPVAEAGPTFELDCGTPSLTLNGAGSSTGISFIYAWATSNGIIISGGNTLTPEVGAAGTYTLTVTDQTNGCTSADQVIVTLDANAPTALASAPQTLTCAVTQVALNGAGSSQGADFTYLWTTANGNIVSGNTTLNPQVNLPGTYLLTVTNLINNCASSVSVMVAQDIVPPTSEAGATATITCTNTTVSLNGAGSSVGPNFTYAWSTQNGNIVSGANSLAPQVNQTGQYTLLVTNTANGCTATDAVSVNINQTPPNVVLQIPGTLTCTVTQLNLGAGGTSTGPNFSYQWTTLGGNITAGANALSPTINAPGTYTLTVTNSQNGCVASESVVVNQNILNPAAEAGNTAQLTCAAIQLQLNGAGSSTGPGFSYLWTTTGGSIQSGATTLTPTISAPGTYTLTVVNAANGCTSTDAVVITQDIVQPTALIGPPPSLTCLVDQVSLNAAGSSNGAGFTLTWSATGGGNIVNTNNILQPLVDQPGSYTLNILNTNNGCSSSTTVVVTETIDPPGASAGPDLVLHCNQPVVQLQGSSPIGAAANFVWSTANGSILSGANTAQPTVGAAGVYTVTVTNPANGCTSSDQVAVTSSIPAAFNYAIDSPICKGFPGYIQFGEVLGGTPPYLYSISGGFAFSAQTFYGNLQAGTYELIVQDANGCELFEEVVLAPGVDVELDVEREIFLNLGESYQVQVFVNVDEADIDSIVWTPDKFLSCNDCLTPLVTPTQSVDYLVTIITEEGCEGEARISFRVKKQANVFVPNIFSPNGDGENDIFMIFAGNQVSMINRFQVFNRWGESVFQYFDFLPNDPAYGWDGIHRGKTVDPGVFVWYAEIEMLDGRIELFEGSVTLIR